MKAELRFKVQAVEQPQKFFRGCAGKMRLPRKVARAIARRAQNEGDVTMRSYRCQVCKGYHDGHVRWPSTPLAASSNQYQVSANGY